MDTFSVGWTRLLVLLFLITLGAPASACNTGDDERVAPAEVARADLVVIGRIANYRVLPNLLDPVANSLRYELLQDALRAEPKQLETLRQRNYALSDFARFDIQIDDVLKGKATTTTIDIRWQNETFLEPQSLPPGPYLIALLGPKSGAGPAKDHFTMVQPSCGRAYLFAIDSDEARQVRKLLSGR